MLNLKTNKYMKFNDLTNDDKNKIVEAYNDTERKWDERVSSLMNLFNIESERTIRRWYKKLGLKKKEDSISPQLKKAKQKKFDKRRKKFIITWAQNATNVHSNFLENVEGYANKINANIHVIAGRYKNPTSTWTANQESDEWWHSSVVKYLDANRHDIHKYMSIMSDVKIQPTAVNPMTGLYGLSGINSCIFGSPKTQLEMIPVLEGQKPKMMLTTGSCTVKNYTDSKAGKKGEFHHTLGFVIVEIKDDETFYVRQVTADNDGNFYDLNNRVYRNENGEVSIDTIDEIEGIVLGDMHFGSEDKDVCVATHKILEKIKPKNVVLHDIFDGFSISHHHMKDAFLQYYKELNNKNSLKGEIDYMLECLREFEKYNNVIIVKSNHDEHLDRWLKDGDWKKQPTAKNSLDYMNYSSILLQQYASDENPIGVIPFVVKEKFPNFITLNRSETYKIKDWEISNHGDVGSSGSRGSLQQFRRLNTKTIIGHSHTPGRKDGVIQVGTSTKLRLSYNKGASSWLNSHAIIHKDGKAQQIHFIDDAFTTMM